MVEVKPVDPKRYDGVKLKDVRNDATYTPEQVIGILKDRGVEIHYGDLCMVVEKAALENCRALAAALPIDERTAVMTSVDRALHHSLKQVKRGTASKKRMDDFYADLMYWTALSELSAS